MDGLITFGRFYLLLGFCDPLTVEFDDIGIDINRWHVELELDDVFYNWVNLKLPLGYSGFVLDVVDYG